MQLDDTDTLQRDKNDSVVLRSVILFIMKQNIVINLIVLLETFILSFLEILKHPLQNFRKT